MDAKAASWVVAAIATALLVTACSNGGTTPATPSAVVSTATFAVTFGENPVAFRSTGCNGSVPEGWYTTARIQESAGVAFTPGALTQRLDGTVASALAESFASRFGACGGAAFAPGTIAANGAVCGVVGVCTTGTYRNYQFDVTGTDANGHALTFSSPMLQFGARTTAPSVPFALETVAPSASGRMNTRY